MVRSRGVLTRETRSRAKSVNLPAKSVKRERKCVSRAGQKRQAERKSVKRARIVSAWRVKSVNPAPKSVNLAPKASSAARKRQAMRLVHEIHTAHGRACGQRRRGLLVDGRCKEPRAKYQTGLV